MYCLFSGHAKWNKRSCGVVCLVKDNPKRSYFIRVLDFDRKTVVFDQEIYNQFRYRSPRAYFHTFEAENGQVGLNFADEGEAAIFQNAGDLTEKKMLINIDIFGNVVRFHEFFFIVFFSKYSRSQIKRKKTT